MVFTLLLAGLIAVMLFAPDTSSARWLHRTMVEEPLRLFERLERKHLIFLVVGLVSIQAFAATLPADLAVMLAWDMTAYVDAMIATWTLSTFARFRSMKAWAAVRARALLKGLRPQRMRARRNRPRPADSDNTSANDDDPLPILAAA